MQHEASGVVHCRPGIVTYAGYETIPDLRCTAYALHRVRETQKLLLRRRCRIELRWIRRRRRLIEALDGGGFAQIRNQFGLRLVRDVILDLAAHFVEGRRRLGALVFDLDDVPAELGMHG